MKGSSTNERKNGSRSVLDLATANRKREYKKRHRVDEQEIRSYTSFLNKPLEINPEKSAPEIKTDDKALEHRIKQLRNKLRARRNNESVREEALRELLLLLTDLPAAEREKHLLFCLSAMRDLRFATLFWSDLMEGLLETFRMAPSDQIILAISEGVTFKSGEPGTSIWAESLLRSSAKCDTELAHETLLLAWSMTRKGSSLRKKIAQELISRFSEYPVPERIKSLRELCAPGISRSLKVGICEALIECANELPEISADRDEALRLGLKIAPYFSEARHRIKTALKAWDN